MESERSTIINSKLVVSLFSDYNFLALSMLENFLSKNCYVNILTSNKKEWVNKTSHLATNKHFLVIDKEENDYNTKSYTLLILGYGELDPYDELREILINNSISTSKMIVVIPFEKYSLSESAHFNFSNNLGVVYLGDLLGPRIDLTNDLLITKVIRSIFFKRKLDLAIGELFYPIFVNDAAKTICRWVFSFGPYGKETLLIGPQTSSSFFWKENANLVGDIKLYYDQDFEQRVLPKGVEIKKIPGNLKYLLTETYKWLANAPPKKSLKYQNTDPVQKNKKKRIYPVFLKPLVLGSLLVLLFPAILQLTVYGMFFYSYKQFISGKDNSSQNTILFAKTLSVISKQESKGLSYIPFFGHVYKELYFTSLVEERTADISITAIPLVRRSSELFGKILGNEIYDPTIQLTEITSGLDSLYREVSLLQADSSEAASQGTLVAKKILNKINFDKFKNITLQMKNLSQNLPQLLGKDNSKTYLILFQNNMELRPTGGFIGSFGILTFDGGRISDLTINDVYSADGQLNGHVEPPEPIRKYLGEANWWLRDSNWDPDFPTSSKRAEWFLDKEMGKSVDGVIGIDLAPIKNILKFTGPIFLPDYSMDINKENLYEKTQAEVQEDFFPGTHKKASFLTALSRSLLAVIPKLETAQKIGILKSFFADLEGRSIQMFFHDDDYQNPITALGWDGGVVSPECGKDCYADMIGLVEANLGVNKTNYFIERNERLDVNLFSNKITRRLTVTLKNKANPSLGASGVYKSYVRLLSGEGVAKITAKIITGQSSQDLPTETINLKGRRETGVYVEVLGGQTKTLEFSWTTDANSALYDKYGIYLRKQAGTGPDPASLTVNGVNVYNGILTRDVFSRVSW